MMRLYRGKTALRNRTTRPVGHHPSVSASDRCAIPTPNSGKECRLQDDPRRHRSQDQPIPVILSTATPRGGGAHPSHRGVVDRQSAPNHCCRPSDTAKALTAQIRTTNGAINVIGEYQYDNDSIGGLACRRLRTKIREIKVSRP